MARARVNPKIGRILRINNSMMFLEMGIISGLGSVVALGFLIGALLFHRDWYNDLGWFTALFTASAGFILAGWQLWRKQAVIDRKTYWKED